MPPSPTPAHLAGQPRRSSSSNRVLLASRLPRLVGRSVGQDVPRLLGSTTVSHCTFPTPGFSILDAHNPASILFLVVFPKGAQTTSYSMPLCAALHCTASAVAPGCHCLSFRILPFRSAACNRRSNWDSSPGPDPEIWALYELLILGAVTTTAS